MVWIELDVSCWSSIGRSIQATPPAPDSSSSTTVNRSSSSWATGEFRLPFRSPTFFWPTMDKSWDVAMFKAEMWPWWSGRKSCCPECSTCPRSWPWLRPCCCNSCCWWWMLITPDASTMFEAEVTGVPDSAWIRAAISTSAELDIVFKSKWPTELDEGSGPHDDVTGTADGAAGIDEGDPEVLGCPRTFISMIESIVCPFAVTKLTGCVMLVSSACAVESTLDFICLGVLADTSLSSSSSTQRPYSVVEASALVSAPDPVSSPFPLTCSTRS